MRKRNLIAALVAASTLITCAACGTSADSGTASTSSGADTYAEWLDDRLGKDVGNVTVGIGDSASLGIDMSNFEDDGYIIKTVGDEVLLFGKTSDGLDRAVRKYAKTVEAGETVENVTYHEGYRIEKLTLFGVDISEFVIEVPNENNANMLFARDELVRLVKIACGTELTSVVGTAESEHKIIFRFSDDEALNENGYRYFEENGNLILEGAVERGCMYAVYRFLQNECGWFGLNFGETNLAEADEVAVPAGLSKSETPILNCIQIHGEILDGYVTERPSYMTDHKYSYAYAQMSYGPITGAMHGFQTYQWDNHPHQWLQPCFTNEDILESTYENVCNYIDRRIAAGETPGVQFKDIDIAMGDNDCFCICKTCSEVLRYDKSNAGAMIQFANKLGDRLEETYPGANLAIKVFAYFSAKKPPEVTVANEHVYVTYCSNGNCANHPINGSLCSREDDNGFAFNDNHQDDEWLRKWTSICDHVYLWQYALDSVLHQYTVLGTIKPDFTYMKEIGIEGLFWQIDYYRLGIKRVEQQLGGEFNWANDMTDEEFEDYLCRVLENEYGDGWRYIREFVDMWLEAQSRVDYFMCWKWANNVCDDSMYDERYISENAEKMRELISKAEALACNTKQETRCKRLSLHVYYEECYSDYFRAYDANDTERLARLDELYAELIDKMQKVGFDPDSIMTVDGHRASIEHDLEREAWNNWIDVREKLWDPDAEHRDPPTWYTESLEGEET